MLTSVSRFCYETTCRAASRLSGTHTHTRICCITAAGIARCALAGLRRNLEPVQAKREREKKNQQRCKYLGPGSALYFSPSQAAKLLPDLV